MIFTWQSQAWEELNRLRRQLPHAVLIQAREGIGAAELAQALAQALLCESPRPEGFACGRCAACNWFRQGNHPDFRLVQPESMATEGGGEADETSRKDKRSEQIRIDQVRSLRDFLAVGTHRAGLRVIVIHPAEAMNPNTQNALLKNLEEPPPGTLFLLVANRPDRLLPTVRSRCLRLNLPVPDHKLALAWLKEQGVEDSAGLLAAAGGAPLGALELSGSEAERQRLLSALGKAEFDPIALAEQMQRTPASEVVTWLQRWSYDLLACRLGSEIRYHPKYEGLIVGISRACRAPELAGYLRVLAQARALAQHPLNPKLFFEDLFFRYRALTVSS
jgi:DNA polymerase-3 subunit delta'